MTREETPNATTVPAPEPFYPSQDPEAFEVSNEVFNAALLASQDEIEEDESEHNIMPNCLICYEDFDDTNLRPMVLIPCGHSVCVQCSAKLRRQQGQPVQNINCPKCNTVATAVSENYDLKDQIGLIKTYRQAMVTRMEVRKTKSTEFTAFIKDYHGKYQDGVTDMKMYYHKIIKERDEYIAKLEADLAEKNRQLWEASKRELGVKIDPHCLSCGNGMKYEVARLCIQCGIQDGYVIQEETDDGKTALKIINFEKAEVNLYCGGCMIEEKPHNNRMAAAGDSSKHRHENYFRFKRDQLTAKTYQKLKARLQRAYDNGWDEKCREVQNSHKALQTELNRVRQSYETITGRTRESFTEKTNLIDNIVDRAVKCKEDFTAKADNYAGEMENLKNEAAEHMEDQNNM